MVTKQEFERVVNTELTAHALNTMVFATIQFKTTAMRIAAFDAMMLASAEGVKQKLIKERGWNL